MIIGYDARLIGTRRTGTVTMQQNLMDKLVENDEHQWILFGNKELIGEYQIKYTNVKVIHVSLKIKPIWEQFILPYYLWREKVDLFYSTKNFTVPLLYRDKTIATILDIIPFKFPDLYLKNKLKCIYNNILLKHSLKAKAIVTISNFSKHDILEIKEIENVHVIPLGPNYIFEDFKKNEVKSNQGIEPYFLTIGGAEPRKNVQTAIDAFSQLKKKGYRYKLVIVGESKWNDYTLKIPSSIINDVQFIGHISDTELFNLVKNTSCFIFPSFYEGFGLPVLEAIFAKVPVIVARNTSLKEIYSETCLMVETMEPSSYVKALEKVVDKNDFQINTENYNSIIKRYTWNNSAKELLQIFENYSNR